jgi:hypothetical protein
MVGRFGGMSGGLGLPSVTALGYQPVPRLVPCRTARAPNPEHAHARRTSRNRRPSPHPPVVAGGRAVHHHRRGARARARGAGGGLPAGPRARGAVDQLRAPCQRARAADTVRGGPRRGVRRRSKAVLPRCFLETGGQPRGRAGYSLQQRLVVRFLKGPTRPLRTWQSTAPRRTRSRDGSIGRCATSKQQLSLDFRSEADACSDPTLQQLVVALEGRRCAREASMGSACRALAALLRMKPPGPSRIASPPIQ